ncbi:Exosome complex component Rrp41 [Porphyridium purpureum]|uniref:Exosome complex component Rrp41 n=1 Tax=Porphyridium purpureum TaxID=35688 RepID=A0A5J4YYY9_PORPP|nr:Exosome complex component Rrp41 [Porphyridium purpureum]|eukprot:POR2753..scf208_2
MMTSTKVPLEFGLGASLPESSGPRPSRRTFARERSRGRDERATRDVRIEFGSVSKADGSAKVTLGGNTGTQVVASVFGPVYCTTRLQVPLQAAVQVHVRIAETQKQGSSDASSRAAVLEKIIKESCLGLIMTHLMPRALVSISVHVLNQNGSVVCAAINAVACALMHARIAMRSPWSAGVVAVVVLPGESSSLVLMDPDAVEEGVAAFVLTAVHGDYAEETGFTALHVDGRVRTQAEFTGANQAALEASMAYREFIREALCAQVVRGRLATSAAVSSLQMEAS